MISIFQINTASCPRELIDSTSLLQDAEALRTRADQDGYLFFRRLLPAEDVLAVRAAVLSVIDGFGWRQPGQHELGGALDLPAINRVEPEQMRLDIGISRAAYRAVQRLEALHRLPHHAKLLHLYKMLFERTVFVHPRHIARLVTSHHAMTPTPPHQDFPLIQGSADTWTCWFPLGDCARSMGSLSVLRGSHRDGYLPIQESSGAGGIAAQLCAWQTDWLERDYETGDVLTFPSYTVHRALPCLQKDQIRLSLDVRYQPVDEEIEANSLAPHCGQTWEEIYEDWQSDDLKYYWRRMPLKFAPWDDTFVQPRRRIC